MGDKQAIQEPYSKKIKIQDLIKRHEYAEAGRMLEEYANIYLDDPDIFCLKGALALGFGNLADAEVCIQSGLKLDSGNVGLLYYMGYLCERKERYNRALNYYRHALDCSTGNVANQVKNRISQLEGVFKNRIKSNQKKIGFFVRKQMDHFLDDIIFSLSEDYETRKVVVTQYSQIDAGMAWADICWFEWCDELVAYGSKLDLADTRKIVCRLHRREVFENYLTRVSWENVDRLILVTEHLKKLIATQVNDIGDRVEITTVHNGLDPDKSRFRNRTPGYNLAYICNIDSRKNPALLLQILQKLVGIDSAYQLHAAGKFVDPLIENYWHYQIERMGLMANVQFDGWQYDIDRWLSDKNYIVSTSMHESFGYNIAEAMAKGIKPVIHDFPFAHEIWDAQYLFNTVEDAVEMITSRDYDSHSYRQYISQNYSLTRQMQQIRQVLTDIYLV